MPVRTQKGDSGDCGGGTHRGQAACHGDPGTLGETVWKGVTAEGMLQKSSSVLTSTRVAGHSRRTRDERPVV